MNAEKKISNIQQNNQYGGLVEQIGSLLQAGRRHVAYVVNTVLVQTYWQIGKYIVEFEQGGTLKAEYGNELLLRLSIYRPLQDFEHNKYFLLSEKKQVEVIFFHPQKFSFFSYPFRK